MLLVPVVLGLLHPTLLSTADRDDVSSTSEGLFVSKYSVFRMRIERNFQLKTEPNRKRIASVIQRAINEANPKHEGLSVYDINQLTREVVTTSQCYGIDPVVYTGLIWRESNFKQKAVSERNARGLTQMTSRGIEEVLDRLSPVSRRRLGHLRSLVKKCSPNFLARVPRKLSADTLAAWRNSMTFSRKDSLVMGALLLKLNLAQAHVQRLKPNDLETYRTALENYNGDPLMKVQFATDVLQLAKRMIALPEVAINDSKFLSQIRGL